MVLRTFSLLVLFSLKAGAEGPITKAECPNIDFSNQLGPALPKGHTNMCHAFVAADLITVNQKIGPENHVSALDVASNITVVDPAAVFHSLPPAKSLSELNRRQKSEDMLKKVQGYLFDWATDMRGGLPDLDVIAYNLRPNICTEHDLPSFQSPVFEASWDYLYGKVRESKGHWDPVFETWLELRDCALQNSKSDFSEFAVSLSHALQRESDTTLRKACLHPLPLKKMVAHNLATSETDTSRIALKLFQQGAPIGIGYDHAVLSGGLADRTESDHASTISASRWNEEKGVCEFKLRNTDGGDCGRYRKDWQCIRGELWLPSKDLDQMTTSLFYIEPQATH